MKKVMSIIAVILCLAMAFAACNNTVDDEATTTGEETTINIEPDDSEKAVIKLGLLKGPTGMGASYLLENSEKGETEAKYKQTVFASPEEAKAAIMNGTVDVAALPSNLAAVLNSKTEGKIQILAVNTLGVLHVMTTDDSVKTVADLKGKTILTSGQGATPEYVINYILQKNDLKVGEDVKVEYVAEHSEVIAKAVKGDYDVIVLPEPFVTQMKTKSDDFKAVIDLTKEWDKLDSGVLAMGCIAVRTDYAKENPDALKAFLKDYEASVKAVNADPEAAGKIIEKFGIMPAAIASKAIPNCNITFIAGEEMKEKVAAFLDVLASFNPKAVGGKVPADDFYCIVK